MNDEIDGTRYRRCICWRFQAGYGHACFDMCSVKQREACKNQQTTDDSEKEQQKGIEPCLDEKM